MNIMETNPKYIFTGLGLILLFLFGIWIYYRFRELIMGKGKIKTIGSHDPPIPGIRCSPPFLAERDIQRRRLEHGYFRHPEFEERKIKKKPSFLRKLISTFS